MVFVHAVNAPRQGHIGRQIKAQGLFRPQQVGRGRGIGRRLRDLTGLFVCGMVVGQYTLPLLAEGGLLRFPCIAFCHPDGIEGGSQFFGRNGFCPARVVESV